MINPQEVLVCTPTLDGKVEMGYAGGLIAAAGAGMMGNIAFLQAVSHISLARNLMAHSFLKSNFQWQVWIDSDIELTAQDFARLMDYTSEGLEGGREENPEGTTVDEAGHALIVTAEYSRKVESLDAVRFGLGFTRIHRSVYAKLDAAIDPDTKAPRIGQFQHKGELITDYYASGPGFANIWFSEDTAFFHLCRLAGITPRVEQRTKLKHWGRKAFNYVPSAVGTL